MKNCIDATDWCEISAGATDICVSEIHPALADVPSELWSRHKYDVGLIKSLITGRVNINIP